MKKFFEKFIFFIIQALCFVALVNMYKYAYKNNFKGIPTKRLKTIIVLYTIGEYFLVLAMFAFLVFLIMQIPKQFKVK